VKIISGWAYPDIDRFMAAEMKADGTYQRGHIDAAMHYVASRRCAIDGGAHVGTWSRVLSGLFARVVAVEPSADTHEALVANMRHFGCANVEIYHAALGAAAGFVSMTWDARAEQLANTGGRYVQTGTEIRRITIDSLQLDAVDFLKLDVEGAEVDALNGARDTIARCRPVVLFENKGFCRRFGHPPDGPHRVLASLGYHQVAVAGKDVIWQAVTP
jgi:FkbM family methyltransferase